MRKAPDFRSDSQSGKGRLRGTQTLGRLSSAADSADFVPDAYSQTGTYVLQAGCLAYVSASFCEALGYESPQDLTGRSFWELVHPEDVRAVTLEITRDEKKPAANPPIFRLLDRSQKPVWVHMRGDSVNWRGKPANVGCLIEASPFGVFMVSLQESLERYETILDDVDIHVGEIDLQGRMTFINDAGCRMWNLPRERLIGLPAKAYMDDETLEKVTQIYRHVFETGIPVKNVVLDVRGPHGEKHTIDTSVSLIRDAAGKSIGFRKVTRDVTEKRNAEKKLAGERSRLEAIFGSVKDAIITVDPDFRVIDANTSTEQICGIGVKDIAGREFSTCSTACGQACREVLRQNLEQKTAVREYRIECDHKLRPQQVVSVSSSPLLDPQGNFLGAVMVIRDITLLRDVERELRERNQFQNLIGRNKTMQGIYSLLEDLANMETTVLVTGESGTGKELVARALHYSGNRAFKPFVTVNCCALAESLLESELFGHVKGAFTGAIKDKQGRFAAADGGTLLLDEIGDISPMIQLKLLRVLQEKEFERVGESTPRKVDVRVIACTNKDLKEKVKRGEFRQDLYYRLKVVEVALPPLRERLEDLPLLVDHFRRTFNERFHKQIEGISSEVLSRFMDYAWPGNVRELEHVMEHAFVLCHGGAITLKHLPADIRHYEPDGDYSLSKSAVSASREADDILAALKKTGWNKSKAARILGIGRRTIYRKIEDYQLSNK
ncbi:MAG: sigma 54-interacting transcriptional regulator [Smithellaceae bacterium]